MNAAFNRHEHWHAAKSVWADSLTTKAGIYLRITAAVSLALAIIEIDGASLDFAASVWWPSRDD
jgi:hypothetical protein